jgi:hypothetical protein
LAAKGANPINGALIGLFQETAQGQSSDDAVVGFPSVNSVEFGAGYYFASQGSCTVVEPGLPNLMAMFASRDAGTVQLAAPSGNQVLAEQQGIGYVAQLPAGSVTSSPGTYTFTASGGMNVGSFTTSINMQSPWALTNTAALASITRSQGATVTWSGGLPNSSVLVGGSASSPMGNVRFYCWAPASAGQFAIPSWMLSAFPSGAAKLVVFNVTLPQTVSATGLDLGISAGLVGFAINATFQ